MDKLLQRLACHGRAPGGDTGAVLSAPVLDNLRATWAGPIASIDPDQFGAWLQTALGNIAADAGDRRLPVAGNVAVIPVRGVVTPRRMEFYEQYGLTTSVDTIRAQLSAARGAEGVAKILMVYDTPGGGTFGVDELAAEIAAAAAEKPVTAHVEYMAASAGYWLAAQASQIVASPSALVGSIGVYMTHVDDTGWREQMGVAVEYISAGRDKLLGAHGPLTDGAREYLQGLVDQTYADFVGAVARGRGVSKSVAAGDQFGAGRVVTPRDALAAGMIDRVATLQDTIKQLDGPGARTRIRQRALNLIGG
jgi:signal peptide peptidase SppA